MHLVKSSYALSTPLNNTLFTSFITFTLFIIAINIITDLIAKV